MHCICFMQGSSVNGHVLKIFGRKSFNALFTIESKSMPTPLKSVRISLVLFWILRLCVLIRMPDFSQMLQFDIKIL